MSQVAAKLVCPVLSVRYRATAPAEGCTTENTARSRSGTAVMCRLRVSHPVSDPSEAVTRSVYRPPGSCWETTGSAKMITAEVPDAAADTPPTAGMPLASSKVA